MFKGRFEYKNVIMHYGKHRNVPFFCSGNWIRLKLMGMKTAVLPGILYTDRCSTKIDLGKF